MPEDIVKPRLDAPGPQGVKENLRRILRFVRVELIIEMMRRMLRIHQVHQLFPQPLYLPIIQNPNSRQITVLIEKTNLFVAQSIAIPVLSARRRREEVADRLVMYG